MADKLLTCSSSEYVGSLGAFDTADACLDAVKAQPAASINYALWRGEDNKGCYTCAITDRGDASTWTFTDAAGAVSFIGPALPAKAKVFAMPYVVHADSSRGLLLVSRSAYPMKVKLTGTGLASTTANVVDGTLDGVTLDPEPGFVAPVSRAVGSDGTLALGPYAIAIVDAGSAEVEAA
mmetsp:Transcript_73619/g.202235  ORF Transcript_73619/g.202235 Transcript_73619/m.202235 type:complete len:179 (+) Transcript_73619:3-539(+)